MGALASLAFITQTGKIISWVVVTGFLAIGFGVVGPNHPSSRTKRYQQRQAWWPNPDYGAGEGEKLDESDTENP